MIVDTERDGWTRVGKFDLGWRKSLRDKHWAQVSRSPLGFSWVWVILRADPVTMCPVVVADGEDISLSAAKDDVDHWNRNYHRHAVKVQLNPDKLARKSDRPWYYECRYCGMFAGLFVTWDVAETDAVSEHAACEILWRRGER